MEATVVVELVKLVAPGSISDHFELKAIDEKTSSITLYFDEKADRIPESLMGKEAVLDGFMNPVELQTFPLKDKAVYLCVRRRRWKEKGTQGSGHSNHYELYRPGMKTTIEFGDFLKEELGLQPDEYKQLWTGLTHQG
jgi:hypothetical protein